VTVTDPTETARALLHRHGLPKDVIDGALTLHAQELAAVQREAHNTMRPYSHGGLPCKQEWDCGTRRLIDLIDPTRSAAAPAGPAPAVGRDTLPTDEDFLVAVEEALEKNLLPSPGFAVLERTRDAVVGALAPLVAELRRLAGEAQQDGWYRTAGFDQHDDYRNDVPAREARQDPTQDGEERPASSAALKVRVLSEIIDRIRGTHADGDSPTDQIGAAQVRAVLAEILADMQPAAVARSGQPETEARCPEAVWAPTPHPPHTWNQSPTHPQRPCPGVPAPE
jgi:hypothetical protein